MDQKISFSRLFICFAENNKKLQKQWIRGNNTIYRIIYNNNNEENEENEENQEIEENAEKSHERHERHEWALRLIPQTRTNQTVLPELWAH